MQKILTRRERIFFYYRVLSIPINDVQEIWLYNNKNYVAQLHKVVK